MPAETSAVTAGITETLCRKMAATRTQDIPAAAFEAASRAVADGFAVALAGSAREEAPRIVADYVREAGAAPRATAFGFGFKTSPASAALVNGVSMHVLDFEPMWNPPTHVASTILPAIAALTESGGFSGREMLAAFVKGSELQGRILLAAEQFTPQTLIFHPPGTVGILGAAAAASHLLGANAGELRNALGIAASRAGALIANVGTMTKATHCGYSASLGLEAALLAKRGLTANPNVLESGYLRAFFSGGVNQDALLAYGEPYRIVDPGLAVKLFPSQFGTHWAINAALDVHAKLQGAVPEAIEIHGPVMNYVNRPKPKTGLDGKFSFQYTAAAAVLDGDVTIDSFTDERRFRPDMESLLDRITLIEDPEIPGYFLGMHVTVTATLAGGRKVSATCSAPKASWKGGPLQESDLARKLEQCFATRLSPDAVRRARELCRGIAELAPGGLAELWALLGTASVLS